MFMSNEEHGRLVRTTDNILQLTRFSGDTTPSEGISKYGALERFSHHQVRSATQDLATMQSAVGGIDSSVLVDLSWILGTQRC